MTVESRLSGKYLEFNTIKPFKCSTAKAFIYMRIILLFREIPEKCYNLWREWFSKIRSRERKERAEAIAKKYLLREKNNSFYFLVVAIFFHFSRRSCKKFQSPFAYARVRNTISQAVSASAYMENFSILDTYCSLWHYIEAKFYQFYMRGLL